jgi:hypothetical protein
MMAIDMKEISMLTASLGGADGKVAKSCIPKICEMTHGISGNNGFNLTAQGSSQSKQAQMSTVHRPEYK